MGYCCRLKNGRKHMEYVYSIVDFVAWDMLDVFFFELWLEMARCTDNTISFSVMDLHMR